MEGCSLRYYGFAPSNYVRGLFQTVCDQIAETAPNDASLRGAIHRGDESFQGLIRISAQAAEFSAFASAKDINKLAQKLSVKIANQIKKWKNERFKNGEGRTSPRI